MMTTELLTGAGLEAALDDIAALRMTVFRAFPYLYDGDAAYERDYLRAYLSDSAVVVVARDGDRIVGAATGLGMEHHVSDFAAPFADRPEPLDQIFYCAESVLLPDYRGQGIGHAFFDAREAHARLIGRRWSAFCSVIRPGDHPRRPQGYRPLDAFWEKRGYAPLPGVVAHFNWTDIDADGPSDHALQFWMKELS
ncbi:GNAT family N-acetyltransferase [Pseudooceanicola algae]|uniref:Uncharacterized protein n=1 Tax=Pseudooceanicola algae TaxID=1537215 RepID=A0A418SGZ2_9RHOB|nr:GNAT family N-acetyltransferase [Pseudooceanicola algae]QPM90316.1 hypothetical protein PSAL_015520 [Pseudooceanicola algae]